MVDLPELNAVVTAVFPNKIRIEVKEIESFKIAGEKLAVGSYLRISDSDDCAIMAVIENFAIEKKEGRIDRQYILEALPIGFLDPDGEFVRGGNNIAIPPVRVQPARKEDIQKVYSQIEPKKSFSFSRLVQDSSIIVPIDGDRFFNRHIAIVGSTGSGKSCTLTTILQKATTLRERAKITFDFQMEQRGGKRRRAVRCKMTGEAMRAWTKEYNRGDLQWLTEVAHGKTSPASLSLS